MSTRGPVWKTPRRQRLGSRTWQQSSCGPSSPSSARAAWRSSRCDGASRSTPSGGDRRDRRLPDRLPFLRQASSPTRCCELDPSRATPAVLRNDGLDYVPTHKWVVFGHHFAAIAGAGPLVGPGARRADGLPAGHAVDPGRRGVRRGGAGLHDPRSVAAPRRPLARPHAARGAGRGPGHRRDGRRAGADDDHPGGARAGRGQGAHAQPVGHVHRRRSRFRSRC